MGRSLSAAVKAYAGAMKWAVKITLRDSTVLLYAEDDLIFDGDTYVGLLRAVSGFQVRRSMTVGSGEFSLSNVDLTIAKLTAAKAFDGATVLVRQLLLNIGTTVEVTQGVLTDEEEGEAAVSFQVVDRFDPASANVPARIYSNLCTAIYKDDECGSTSVEATCSKTFAQCIVRVATERFNGFPTVNRKGLKIISTIGRAHEGEGGGDPNSPLKHDPAEGFG
jgi:phage-related protein